MRADPCLKVASRRTGGKWLAVSYDGIAVEADPDGFLGLKKPKGMTSTGAVEAARRILGARAGHAGTLDPMAEGLLVIAVGESRKFIRFLEDDKEYEGTLRLGQESDTLDSEGTLSSPVPVNASERDIILAASKLEGEIEMPVPLYSAVHVKGERLYRLARAGASVEPPVRRARIESLKVTAVRIPDVDFRVVCSGGTYIRSLAARLGKDLGCGAHLTALKRTRSGAFSLADAVLLDDLSRKVAAGRIGEILVPPERALAALPAFVCDETQALMGQSLPATPEIPAQAGARVRLQNAAGRMIGIGRVGAGTRGEPVVLPERMIADRRSKP